MPTSKKKKTTPAPIIHNELGNDELALIAEFTMKHKNSCEETAAFLEYFAQPGVWRVAAEKLGWGEDVSTRKNFVERCLRERQNSMAAQYNPRKKLTAEQKKADLAVGWKEDNSWVVPGLVVYQHSMHGPDGGIPFTLESKKGKLKVQLVGPYGDNMLGLALKRTSVRGTEYAVKVKKEFLHLTSRAVGV